MNLKLERIETVVLSCCVLHTTDMPVKKAEL